MLGVNSNISQGGRLANDTVNVTISCMAASSCTMDPLRKRLPSSLTVGRLRSMCSRAFDIDYSILILHLRETNVSNSSVKYISYQYTVRKSSTIFLAVPYFALILNRQKILCRRYLMINITRYLISE